MKDKRVGNKTKLTDHNVDLTHVKGSREGGKLDRDALGYETDVTKSWSTQWRVLEERLPVRRVRSWTEMART